MDFKISYVTEKQKIRPLMVYDTYDEESGIEKTKAIMMFVNEAILEFINPVDYFNSLGALFTDIVCDIKNTDTGKKTNFIIVVTEFEENDFEYNNIYEECKKFQKIYSSGKYELEDNYQKNFLDFINKLNLAFPYQQKEVKLSEN